MNKKKLKAELKLIKSRIEKSNIANRAIQKAIIESAQYEKKILHDEVLKLKAQIDLIDHAEYVSESELRDSITETKQSIEKVKARIELMGG